MDMWVYKLNNHEKNKENIMEIYWDSPPQLRSAVVAPNTLRNANLKLLSLGHKDVEWWTCAYRIVMNLSSMECNTLFLDKRKGWSPTPSDDWELWKAE